MTTARLIPIDRGDHGRRVDLVLRRHLRDLPTATRTRVQAWIRDGQVTVNGHVVRRAAQRTLAGDAIVVQLPVVSAPAPMAAENVALAVLHEDPEFLIVDKPAGIVVHPTYRHDSGTLLNAILWHGRDWPDGQRPSVVGRLDKLTSGLVVIARTQRMHAALQRAFASRETEKDYLALVYGKVKRARGTIHLRLARDLKDRRRVVASGTVGNHAETEFVRLACAAEFGVSLLRCRLRTGRMHQIRVHLSASGWPIVGDPRYGDGAPIVCEPAIAAELRSFPRQALHAWRLSFPHPTSGRRVTVVSPPAPDLSRLFGLVGVKEPR